MTYKYQLIDVIIAAILKRYIAAFWSAWMAKRLEKCYDTQEGYRPASLNYIKPTLGRCVVWANSSWKKINKHKRVIAKRAKDLYMHGNDTEIMPFLDDYRKGKFECSYKPEKYD